MVTTNLPTLVRVTRSRERPEKTLRVTKARVQLCATGNAEQQLGPQDGKSLERAFQQYLEYRTVREPIMEDNRWQNVLKLRKLLVRPEHASIRLAGREHALYEELHRSNPERFVSKSRFMVIMRRVFGFELAPVRGAVDADVKILIESVFDAFDERSNDKMEWRGILLMLHVVMKPWLPPADHFLWGFAMVGSEGSFDPTCREPFDARLANVKHMLFTLGHVKSRPMLTKLVDDSWANFCKVDKHAFNMTRTAETRKLLSAASGKKKAAALGGAMNDNEEMNVADGVKLSLPVFERLLETSPLKEMLGAYQFFGVRDKRTWTYIIEEQQYHPMIFREIRRMRLQRRHDEAVDVFRKTHQFREKRRVKAWREVAHRIHYLKEYVLQTLKTGAITRMRGCFAVWQRSVLLVIRILELQRVARGYLGRKDARWIWRVHSLVTGVQARIRKMLVMLATRRELRRRTWAAMEIERHARALNARRIVMWRLEAHIDRERRKLERKKREWAIRREVHAARVIQQSWRARVARLALAAEKKRREAAILTVRDMERIDADNKRRRKIYEVQLEEWYKVRKAEHEMNTMYEDFGASERAKILRFRRKQMYDGEREKERRAHQLASMLADERVAAWITRWEQIKVDRVAALRARLDFCRTTPETAEERAIGRRLAKDVKARGKLVLKRAFKAGVPLELPEAEELALEEVLLKRQRDEERQVDVERTKAADEHYAHIAEAERLEREERLHNINRVQNNAARAIQKQRELHEARVDLRRRAFERYEKRYDVDLRAFYYVNTLTREPQWLKPYALGPFDIKLKDEWVVHHDETGEPYYYNPSTQEMSWSRPISTVFCADCDHFFCEVYCNTLNVPLCQQCYDAAHAEDSVEAQNENTWKILKGGDPESGKADIQALEDTGKALEAERAKAEEEARVARRQSVRRSTAGAARLSTVGRELAKMREGKSFTTAGQASSLAAILADAAAPEEVEEQLEQTQRETGELMMIVEARAKRRAERDDLESAEDPAGKRNILEYRRPRRRPSELLRLTSPDAPPALIEPHPSGSYAPPPDDRSQRRPAVRDDQAKALDDRHAALIVRFGGGGADDDDDDIPAPPAAAPEPAPPAPGEPEEAARARRGRSYD